MNRTLRLALAAALCLAGSLAGCARSAAPPPAAPAPLSTSALEVRPGDRVALKIYREEAMSDTFLVAESGEVVLPKLGVVRVGGSQVATLEDSLRLAYAKYLKNPAVSVTVLRRVGVHGEVNDPGLYLVDLTMTLRDVIAQAGGITNSGDENKIFIIRDERRFRVGEGESARFMTAELRSGDQVLVGQRPWIERNSLAFASTAATVVALVVPVLRSVF